MTTQDQNTKQVLLRDYGKALKLKTGIKAGKKAVLTV
jgi:hypothetical protein